MPPAVLGIDTSSSWCSAALVRGVERFVRRAEVGSAHSDHILKMIEAVLVDADISLEGCDAVAYSAGPGSFTGLRIGCAVAMGLAFGASLPVASIGTLEAIGWSVRRVRPRGSLLVAQDARMGELYWSLFDRTDDALFTVAGPSLATPSTLRDALPTFGLHATVGCGNAWSVHGDALQGLVERVIHRASADAVEIAYLGVDAHREGRLIAADQATPIYVRDDVARTTAERATAAARVAAIALDA